MRPLDPRIAVLAAIHDVDLPSPLGWQRFVAAAAPGSGQDCDLFWQRPWGAHRVRVHDDLSVDHDGEWFAQWPAALRVAPGSYDGVVLLWSKVSAPQRPRAPRLEQPIDALAEAHAWLRSRPACAGARPQRSELGAIVLASWVSLMGRDELASQIVARLPPPWDSAQLRRVVAGALASSARRSFVQGMPRALVRALLDQADTLCECGRNPQVAEVRDRLGDDPSGRYDADDPQSLLAWLPEDLVLFAATPAQDLGWAEATQPRSPGLELFALGWPALPSLVAHARDGRSMRADPRRQVGDAARAIAAEIARRPFASADELERWWAEHRDDTELDALITNLGVASAAAPSLRRVLQLDRAQAVARLLDAWPALSVPARRALLTSLPEVVQHDDALAAEFEPLRLRALEDDDVTIVASAVDSMLERGRGAWVDIAVVRARALVRGLGAEQPSDAERDALVALLVAIASVDRDVAASLLREGLRREHRDPAGAAAQALSELCETDEDAATPSCVGAVRRLHRGLPAPHDDRPQ